MQTLLTRIRLIVGIMVLFFPLIHFFRRIHSLTRTASQKIQSQIDQVKERLSHEGASEGVIESPTFPDLENESTKILLIEENTDEVKSISAIGEKGIIDSKQTIDDDEQASSSPSQTEIEISIPPEKLAQQIEDIRYAALTYKERGKKEDYEKKLIEGISLASNNEEFLIMLADHYFEEAQYVKAATLLKKIIHVNPHNHKALWQLGQIYLHEKDREAAQVLFEKARDLKDDNPKYLISLVEFYYEAGNLNEAVTHVEKLTRLRPTNIDYLLTLAKLYEELKQPTRAHTYYMKVLELNPLQDEAKKALKRLL